MRLPRIAKKYRAQLSNISRRNKPPANMPILVEENAIGADDYDMTSESALKLLEKMEQKMAQISDEKMKLELKVQILKIQLNGRDHLIESMKNFIEKLKREKNEDLRQKNIKINVLIILIILLFVKIFDFEQFYRK
ncbi:unnamed protein product [Caenorhabditis angaria]|uniref:Uncharacterized protein n=1 Tax=Caenorhabditis angaria TaxID=860376 RepID=A0A9P1MVE6_9PELO|nr:unnamed protein product [Caenorhabditis angaria]